MKYGLNKVSIRLFIEQMKCLHGKGVELHP